VVGVRDEQVGQKLQIARICLSCRQNWSEEEDGRIVKAALI